MEVLQIFGLWDQEIKFVIHELRTLNSYSAYARLDD